MMSLASLCLVLAPHAPQGNDPLEGVWKLQGESGRSWEARLVLTRGRGRELTGHFEWKTTSGEPASGREPFRGWFDAAGTLELHGARIEDAEGNITQSIYRALVSGKGTRLVQGEWGGPGVFPGNFTAEWCEAPTPPVLDALIVRTDRADELVDFYRRGLLLGEAERRGVRTGWQLGSLFLAIEPAGEDLSEISVVTLRFSVRDVVASAHRLERNGARVVGLPDRETPSRVAVLVDPAGNRIELAPLP